MKKISFMLLGLTLTLASVANASVENNYVNEGVQNSEAVTVSVESTAQMRETKIAKFEKRLGLTEDQKVKFQELRKQSSERMNAVMKEIQDKKLEARAVKLSRIAVRMQEEKLAAIDKEITVLQKQAIKIKKQTRKEFESILTRNQRRILKQMRKERLQYNQVKCNCNPCTCPKCISK